jgi:NADH-quinone oxidoreductase subunit M
MPVFATIFLAVAFSSIALPGTNGFIGEFMILLGTWQASPWHTVFAVTGAILGAWYLLGAVKQVFFGEAHLAENRELEDVTRREILLAAPFLVAIIWFGVYPKPLIDLVKPECARLEAHVAKAVSAHAATKGD